VDGESAARAALELLRETQLSDDEVRTTADEALEPDFWRALNPSLSVGAAADAAALELEAIPVEERDALAAHVRKHGYFHTAPTLDRAALARLRDAIDVLRDEGLPPSFCFVYDEYWLLARTPSLIGFAEGVLGPGYRQISNVWCHYVHAAGRASGWQPHVDGFHNPAGRLTFWIPLTDATLDNGCMYLIPKDRIAPQTSIEQADVRTLLQAARAMPAQAGEVLGWDFEVIHWGSAVSEAAKEPRISLSFELIAASAEPEESERPLFDLFPLPTLEERLYGVCRGVLQYARFEPSLVRFTELAKRIGARVEPVALKRTSASA
jgi:hypothetical protein